MDIYKLKKQELQELDTEFSKTDFGRRAKFFSILPFWCAVFALLAFVVDDILGDGCHLFCCLIFLNVAIFGIAQLHYGNLLKEYIQSKKDN